VARRIAVINADDSQGQRFVHFKEAFMSTQTFALRQLAIAALCCAAGASQAAITVATQTTPTTFAAAVLGAIDTFSNLTINSNVGPSLARSAGSIGYTLSAQSDMFTVPVAGTNAVSTGGYFDTLLFNGFGTPVRSFGANFFGSNVLGEATGGRVTVVVTDTSNVTFSTSIVAGAASSFIGFLSDAPIASVVAFMTSPNTNTWVTTDNVVLATTVPEANTWLMLALGGVAVLRLAASRRA
jgi:hypothetical protein